MAIPNISYPRRTTWTKRNFLPCTDRFLTTIAVISIPASSKCGCGIRYHLMTCPIIPTTLCCTCLLGSIYIGIASKYWITWRPNKYGCLALLFIARSLTSNRVYWELMALANVSLFPSLCPNTRICTRFFVGKPIVTTMGVSFPGASGCLACFFWNTSTWGDGTDGLEFLALPINPSTYMIPSTLCCTCMLCTILSVDTPVYYISGFSTGCWFPNSIYGTRFFICKI